MSEQSKPHVPLFFTDSTEVMLHDHEKDRQEKQAQLEQQQLFSDDYFEIDTSVETIKKFAFKRVALQIPDNLLWAARTIVSHIEAKCNNECKVFILGDTSYGSCCVDEVTGSHLKADFIIHYGHSCLSPATKLPVQYVFGKKSVDETKFIEAYKNQFKSDEKVVVFYSLEYSHQIKSLSNSLREYQSQNIVITDIDNFNNIYYSQSFLNNNNNSNNNNSECGSNNKDCCSTNQNVDTGGCCGGGDNRSNNDSCCNVNSPVATETSNNNNNYGSDLVFGRKLSIDIKDIQQYKILWIGDECITLTNLLMNFNMNTFYRYNPRNNNIQQVTLSRNQSLMKRYYISNKCKEANIIGIVVATLTVQKYSETIDSLKKLIIKSGKKPYVFVVGRLNVPKLANFSEIDIFVIVACPENTIVDSKEYYKPIATPFELNMALKGDEWTGEYVTDFGKLFPQLVDQLGNENNTQANVERAEDDVSDEEGNRYHFSLTTGKIMKYYTNTNANQSNSDDNGSGEIVSVDNKFKQLSTTAMNASEYFANRTYRGLETKIGETEVTKAVIGKSGIPKSYDNDIANQ